MVEVEVCTSGTMHKMEEHPQQNTEAHTHTHTHTLGRTVKSRYEVNISCSEFFEYKNEVFTKYSILYTRFITTLQVYVI